MRLSFVACSLVPIVAALGALGCDDEATSNTIDFSIGGNDSSWSSNDGGCQLRNQGSLLDCYVEVGAEPDEEDFSFSVSVGFAELIEETTYVDVQATEFPNVEFALWVDGCRFETPASGSDQTVTINRLTDVQVRGNFEATVECADTGASESLTGSYYLKLSE
jgi:hypothetical protein